MLASERSAVDRGLVDVASSIPVLLHDTSSTIEREPRRDDRVFSLSSVTIAATEPRSAAVQSSPISSSYVLGPSFMAAASGSANRGRELGRHMTEQYRRP